MTLDPQLLALPPGHPSREQTHPRPYHQIQLLYMIAYDLGEYLRRIGIETITRPIPIDEYGALYSEENDGLYRICLAVGGERGGHRDKQRRTYLDDDMAPEKPCYVLLLHTPSGVAEPAGHEGSRKLMLFFNAPDPAQPSAPLIFTALLDAHHIQFLMLAPDLYELITSIDLELMKRFQERAAELLQLTPPAVVEDSRCVLGWDGKPDTIPRYWTGDFFNPWTTDTSKAQVFESGDKGFLMARVLEHSKSLLGFDTNARVDFKLIAYTSIVTEAHAPLPTFENREGIAVTDLKAVLANWPDLDNNGTPNRVYLSVGGETTLVCRLAPVNTRVSEDGNREWADLSLISP